MLDSKSSSPGANARIVAIVVSHDSGSFLHKVIEHLRAQSRPVDKIIIVDSGSTNTEYLSPLRSIDKVTIIERENIGFCAANNLGIAADGATADYYLLVNPDVLLTPSWLQEAIELYYSENGNSLGCLSSPLLGYDMAADRPTGLYDSLGIYRRPSGRWYDLGQGKPIGSISTPSLYHPKAICGALMLLKGESVRQLLSVDGEVFDESLFMYKDDIDLSARLRRNGWKIMMASALQAYHCRGWAKSRKTASAWGRLLSARNEIKVALKQRSPYLPVYLLKYCYVRFIELAGKHAKI